MKNLYRIRIEIEIRFEFSVFTAWRYYFRKVFIGVRYKTETYDKS